MNPIFSQAMRSQPTPQGSLKNILNIKNPRESALKAIANMTQEQRTRFQALMPMAYQIANKFGINFDTVAAEINNFKTKG